jgi:hypothetical protein
VSPGCWESQWPSHLRKRCESPFQKSNGYEGKTRDLSKKNRCGDAQVDESAKTYEKRNLFRKNMIFAVINLIEATDTALWGLKPREGDSLSALSAVVSIESGQNLIV